MAASSAVVAETVPVRVVNSTHVPGRPATVHCHPATTYAEFPVPTSTGVGLSRYEPTAQPFCGYKLAKTLGGNAFPSNPAPNPGGAIVATPLINGTRILSVVSYQSERLLVYSMPFVSRFRIMPPKCPDTTPYLKESEYIALTLSGRESTS